MDPDVTPAAVRLAVAGEHTAAGSVITTAGVGLTVTVTAFISKQPAAVVPLIYQVPADAVAGVP